MLGVEWPTALVLSDVLAGLSTGPDSSPDPVPSPRVKQAENCVDDMLCDEKSVSSACSPFPDNLPLIAMLTLRFFHPGRYPSAGRWALNSGRSRLSDRSDHRERGRDQVHRLPSTRGCRSELY